MSYGLKSLSVGASPRWAVAVPSHSGPDFSDFTPIVLGEILQAQCDTWSSTCKVCMQQRKRFIRPHTRSVAADDSLAYVVIDIADLSQRTRGGEKYMMSYQCTVLKVPKLAVMK